MNDNKRPARVLVVDDEDRNRRLLVAMLEADGHVPLEAAGGAQALGIVRLNPPDLILLDVMMPDMDGYAVARTLKADAATRSIPVVMVTALGDEESWRRGMEAGASDFVTKPVDRTRLRLRVRNLLQLKEYSDALDRSRRTAQDNDQAKSDFLATMSHEIRTPMNSIVGMLELLGLTRLDVEQRATLEVVRSSSQSLLRIVDDILDFSKIEAGKLEIRPEVASVAQIVEHVRNLHSNMASSKGLTLSDEVDPDIPPALWVDAVRLRQILHNFVSNAIKFTSKGSIKIKAVAAGSSDGLQQLRFTVQDSGVGISPEAQRRLFQPYSQDHSDTRQDSGGTGLGLTICRRLAEMMDGSVEMESKFGEGTTLTLALSLRIADPEELRPAPAARALELLVAAGGLGRSAPTVAQAEAAGTLVLLVDDHPTNRAVLTRQLRTLGYASESAEDGLEALQTWKSGRFGIVIADCNMPRMDGYELARSVRHLEAASGSARKPIIACTANAFAGEEEKCRAAGMDDYLVKPIELAQLLDKLERWLPLSRGTGAADPSTVKAGTTSSTPAEPLDRAVIAATWGGDEVTVRAILLEFQRFNDQDAAMLKQAVLDINMAQAAHATHRMLGSSRIVGATAFGDVCDRMHSAIRLGEREALLEEMPAFEAEWTRLNAHIDSLLAAG